jgi:DNA-binding LytR/AlgR family response regulator
MPGLTGMDLAARIAGLCHIVFVTAFDRYAVEAFEREAVDYLLKPVSKERLMQTVQRLKDRIESTSLPAPQLTEVVHQLLLRLPAQSGREHLRWIRTQHKDSTRLIPVEDVDYFKAEDKYTLVMTREGEFLIKKSIKELAEELDPAQFWQIHRSTIVNVSRIGSVSHSLTGRGVIKLKERSELLTVSRNYLHLFKHM